VGVGEVGVSVVDGVVVGVLAVSVTGSNVLAR